MRKIKLKTRIIFASLFFILFIFLYYIGVITPIKNSLQRSLMFIQKKFYSVNLWTKKVYHSPLFDFRNSYDLSKENTYLKDQLQDLKIKSIQLELLENENKNLRELLKFFNVNNYQAITAEVVGRGEGNANTLVINRGANDGIRIGLAVVNPKGLVIGKILKVDDVSSHILLLNDNQSRIAGTILNYEETAGVIEGELGLTMRMNLIPQNILLKQGDVIITSGLEKDIPYGLIVGQVNTIEKRQGNLFQSANIQPLFPLDNYRILGVILPKVQK